LSWSIGPDALDPIPGSQHERAVRSIVAGRSEVQKSPVNLAPIRDDTTIFRQAALIQRDSTFGNFENRYFAHNAHKYAGSRPKAGSFRTKEIELGGN